MKKRIVVMLCCALSLLSAQEFIPRIAVLPFEPINISEQDATVLTGLFETALVKTEAYHVIEQTQMSTILETQEISLTGCTDEACAVEFGKLLSAEQIILGSISAIGDKFIINAKIIDVTSGKNIKADKAEAGTIGDLTESSELLAYKLAGFVTTGAVREEIATQFGELFIETVPSGAEVRINGIPKGTSPFLAPKVPMGKVYVECFTDNLYGSQEVVISDSLARVKLTLETTFGRIFIKTGEGGLNAYLDGVELGLVDSGFFENIPVGTHKLELYNDSLYWSDTIDVAREKTLTVTAHPKPCGSFRHILEDGLRARITGDEFDVTVEGAGTLFPIPPGDYSVRFFGDDFVPLEEHIRVGGGDAVELNPLMQYSEGYFEKRFSARLEELNRSLTEKKNVKSRDLESYDVLAAEVRTLPHPMEKTLARIRLSRLKWEIPLVQAEYDRKTGTATFMRRTGWVTAGIGGLLGITGGIFTWMAENAYDKYLSTSVTSLAEEYRENAETYDELKWVLFGSAGVGVAAALPFLFLGPDTDALESELHVMETEMTQLQGGE